MSLPVILVVTFCPLISREICGVVGDPMTHAHAHLHREPRSDSTCSHTRSQRGKEKKGIDFSCTADMYYSCDKDHCELPPGPTFRMQLCANVLRSRRVSYYYELVGRTSLGVAGAKLNNNDKEELNSVVSNLA